jgi:hypothetical protein
VIRRWALWLVCLSTLLAPRAAWAHGRSTSWSAWTAIGGEIEVQVRLARLDLSALPGFAGYAAGAGDAGDDRALAAYLEDHLRAETAAGPCEVDRASYAVLDARAAGEGFLSRSWRVRCKGGGRVRIVADLLFDEVPSHVHFATFTRAGVAVAERVLTHDARGWDVGEDARDAPSAGILDFVALGVRHVATGADHLVFVLALLVAAGSLRALAAVVTGFTLGHSATLALAVLGGVRPDTGAIEALVGASIAVVAVENVWLEQRDPWLTRGLVGALGAAAVAGSFAGAVSPAALAGVVIFVACYFGLLARSDRPARLRWIVAALFGTVHGFAFSGVLAEMSLPRARLASSLLGFNVGVELGQLAVVAAAWPLWRMIAKTPARSRALQLGSAAALAAGTYWFVGRAFGGV